MKDFFVTLAEYFYNVTVLQLQELIRNCFATSKISMARMLFFFDEACINECATILLQQNTKLTYLLLLWRRDQKEVTSLLLRSVESINPKKHQNLPPVCSQLRFEMSFHFSWYQTTSAISNTPLWVTFNSECILRLSS